MDRHIASTSRRPLAQASMEPQENQKPVHVRSAAKDAETAATAIVKAPRSSSVDTGRRTQRRALQSIDSNRPRPVSSSVPPSTKPKLSVLGSLGLKDPLEAEKVKTPSGQAKQTRLVSTEPRTAPGEVITGHKRSATEAGKGAELSGQQEGENLAWMDMMLALLEKRYGPRGSLSVGLAELEAANMFQSPQHKRQKAGIAAGLQQSGGISAVRPRSSLDAGRIQTATSDRRQAVKNEGPVSLNTQQISARFSHELDEQAREDKRQRLLLRHAQQIQESSVSSSTSCGCKTGCLKMYCMCFSSRGFCHSGCGCEDCKNTRSNKTERVEAIQNYLANDPRAFSYASHPQDASKTGFLHLLPQKASAVVMRGCRCKKSKCLKKYCECFQNGIACSSHCRCMECSNHTESVVAHQHRHLKKVSTTAHGTAVSSTSTGPKPFHPVHITVTKQPRRNLVGKTLRLNL